MKKILSLLIAIPVVLAAFSSVPVAKATYDDPLPNSSCINGLLKIYMNPQGVSSRHAVRIDNRSNGWNGIPPLPGDIVMNSVNGSAFVREMGVGNGFGWWIHDVDAKERYSPARGGEVYCGPSKPTGLRTSYDHPSLTLSWEPVEGAVRYAIRVDDKTISPGGYDPKNPAADDKMNDNLKTNSFTFGIGRNRNITFWVHAVDKNGVFSPSSEWFHYRTN